MRAVDGLFLNSASASSPLAALSGGKYRFTATATWSGGSVSVQQMQRDGVTLIDVSAGGLTADGSVTYDLPPGSYQLVVATATAVYASLVRVPLE